MNTLLLAKRRLVIVVIIVLMAGLVWFLCLNPRGAPLSVEGLAPSIPPKAERLKMSRLARIQLLERYGQVPEDADISDWQLAEHTSWWGKPIDPKTFWKGRILWLDESNSMAARRRGRMYPPIPSSDPTVRRYKDDDKDIDTSRMWEVEGPNLRFRYSNHERSFWDKFQKTQLKPPAELERQQLEMAEDILASRHFFEDGNPGRTTARRVEQGAQALRRSAIEFGYPAEAMSDGALLWAYVGRQRSEYQKLLADGDPTNSASFRAFFFKLAVDPQLVLTPLSAENLKAANAWKFAYLQRLRREKTDESYINAYLKAWNLSREEVFGESQK